MKSLLKSASVIAFVAMVAACGGSREEDPVPADETVADEVTVPATMPTPGEIPGPAETPAAGETPEPTATPTAAAASPSPTAAPTAAATRAAAPVAAASPPAMFAVCGACHSVTPGDHGIGPSLAGVFGAKSAHAEGFDYSPAMQSANLTWNEATLNRFLENPREVVPGTTMAYAGLKNPQQRQAVIDYLKGL
jgi:cytochrome c2